MDNFNIPENLSPQERVILEEYRKTGKLPDQMSIKMECHSALCAETPILVGEIISTMRQIHMAYSGQPVKTFALDTKYNIAETEIIEVPKEIYIPSTVNIGLSYGFHFECSPTTLILTEDGYVEAKSLNKEKTISVFMFNASTGKFMYEQAPITMYEYHPLKQLQVPAYLFVSQYENLLLPYYIEGSSGIAFVDVKQ